MILDKNWKFPLCFIFNKIRLEIKSNDHCYGRIPRQYV